MARDVDLIAAIYDAVIEPFGWDDVVKRIVEASKSAGGALFIDMGDTAHLSALCNADSFYAEAYVQDKPPSRSRADNRSGRDVDSNVHLPDRFVQSLGFL
jgi:hypothetical protein